MDEIKKPEEDATLKGQDFPPGKESNSGQTPRTFTQEEHNKGVEDGIAQYGDRIKREQIDPITKERDTLKTEVGKYETKLTDVREELGKLEQRIEELASDDPEMKNVEKRANQLREQERTLKDRTRDAEAKEAANTESQIRIDKWDRDQDVYKVADEFVTASGEDVDKDSFMANADQFNVIGKDKLVDLAKALGYKPKEGTPSPVTQVKPYSGKTSGGADDFSNLSPREKIDKGIEIVKQKTK